MDNYTGLINVLVIYEENPERLLFFEDTMSHTELARAKRAHGTYLNCDENEDTQWLFNRYFTEMGQQIKEDAGSLPFEIGASVVIHFGCIL